MAPGFKALDPSTGGTAELDNPGLRWGPNQKPMVHRLVITPHRSSRVAQEGRSRAHDPPTVDYAEQRVSGPSWAGIEQREARRVLEFPPELNSKMERASS